MINPLIFQIDEAIKSGSNLSLLNEFVFSKKPENELLFFFKPECFTTKKSISIIEMVFEKFKQFEVEINGALLLGGGVLEKLKVMDRHYGYINELSRNASKLVDENELINFKADLGINKNLEKQVLGGHEFLAKYQNYDAASLNQFWITKKSIKLRSGFYFQNYQVEGLNCLLVNGFHPEQLQHFINPSHKIVILLLHSNVSWKSLKDKLAGDTFPEKADVNSIRGELLANSTKYGVEDVSISNNFIHLSAGPFEALFEIRNFLSNVIPDDFDIFECNLFNKLMLKGIPKESINKSLKNPKLAMGSRNTDLFTITENLNTGEAVSNFNSFIHK